ncbi:MAG: universal stress protein, partial [Chloroflexi bacterium]|nr:universal stress protein [Chloroflexota bacterium]
MFNEILVPLDGSELAESALDPALALARKNCAELILLRVLPLEPIKASAGGHGAVWPDPIQKRLQEEAKEYLRSVRKRRAETDMVLRRQVSEGDAADVILETARAEYAGLIVMASHGYSGITRLVKGNVAERKLGDLVSSWSIPFEPHPYNRSISAFTTVGFSGGRCRRKPS